MTLPWVRNSHGAQVIQLVTLRFEGDRIGAVFFGGVPAWARHYKELTITGVNGFVRAENMVRVITHLDRPVSTQQPRWQALDEEDLVLTSVHTATAGGSLALFLSGYVGEVQHFFDCLRTRTPPQPSASDNVQTMALCDRILRALGATSQLDAFSPSQSLHELLRSSFPSSSAAHLDRVGGLVRGDF